MFFSIIPTSSIAPHTYAVQDKYVNFFLYQNKENTICFDAGINPIRIRAELQKIKIAPEKITHIFLTHSDKDHVGGLSLFHYAHLYLPELEVPMITGERKRALFSKNPNIARDYFTIADDEIFQIGTVEIKAISTPGHTPGSMSYLVNNEMLMAGDTIQLKKNRATIGYSFLSMDKSQQRNSLKKLAHLENIKLLNTAHSGLTHDFELVMKKWKYTR